MHVCLVFQNPNPKYSVASWQFDSVPCSLAFLVCSYSMSVLTITTTCTSPATSCHCVKMTMKNVFCEEVRLLWHQTHWADPMAGATRTAIPLKWSLQQASNQIVAMWTWSDTQK